MKAILWEGDGFLLLHVVKRIVEGITVSIDATHIGANTIKKTPERLMKYLPTKIIKTYTNETRGNLDNIPEVPKHKGIGNHKKAKAVMKKYLGTVIGIAEKKLNSPIYLYTSTI